MGISQKKEDIYFHASTEKQASDFARIKAQQSLKTLNDNFSVGQSNKLLSKSSHGLKYSSDRKDLHQLFEKICIPLFAINREHIVTHWNTACVSLTGINSVEMVGSSDQWRAFYDKKRPVLADLIVDQCSEDKIHSYYPETLRRSTLIDNAYEAETYFPNLGQGGYWLYFTAAPLYNEKSNIIGAIETLQDISEREKARADLQDVIQKLRVEQKTLEEKNVILKGVLEQIDSEKKEISDRIHSNVTSILLPLLDRMENKSNPEIKLDMDQFKKALMEITGPFVSELEKNFSRLSPRELEICNYIKNGLESKAIAGIFNVSVGTIQQQRKTIRKKLDIANRKINLSAYLQNL